MKYVLLSFFSMVLGFTGIYMGLLALDYITKDSQVAEKSNIATLATSEKTQQTQNFIERVEAQNEDETTTETVAASTSDSTINTAGTNSPDTTNLDTLLIATTTAKETEELVPDIVKSEVLESEKSTLDKPTEEIKPVVQKAKETILKVPLYIQEFKNSCEAAALRMALAYKNVQVSNDMELIQKFGYSPVRKDVINNIWTDPQKEFVGFVDERCSECGYGVYGIPVTRTARTYGVNAIYLTDVIPSVLAAELSQDNPIIVWGYTSISEPYTWRTPTGGTVKAFKGLHARVLVGFRGEKQNPKGFYLNDPLTGKQEFWNTANLVAHMNGVPGVTNQMVVIR